MLRTIHSDQLRPGMYIHKLRGNWLDHPFWRTAFLAEDDHIQKIVESGVDELVIDTDKGVDVFDDADSPATESGVVAESPAESVPIGSTPHPMMQEHSSAIAPTPPKPSASTRFLDELGRARQICQRTKTAVQEMMNEARLGNALNAAAALPVVDEITASVQRNQQVLVSVARLKHTDDYTYMHSVAVCALMVSLARQLGLDEATTRAAGLGGLLHDMGKALIPLDVLNKPGKLTDAEFSIVKNHPADGRRILAQGGMRDQAVLAIVLHHHEKVDGSGYPHALIGDRLPLLVRMAAVCDVYDAITSNRPYKEGWDPAEALRRMASWKGHFDYTVFKTFVRALGIYPVGALVRLASDLLGVVTEQHPEVLLTPKVRVFFSVKSKEQVPVRTIDLSEPSCNDRIIGIESPKKWGFQKLETLWAP